MPDETVEQKIEGLDARAQREREYLSSAGREALICSLSGGVDSATTAAVAQRAAPGRAVALLLPCSSEEELQGERGKDIVDGQRAADHLGLPAVTINLSELWRLTSATLAGHAQRMAAVSGIALDDKQIEWAVNNLKPTLRMMAAGFFADAFRGLTMGTDNAIENFLGYFSVRGDGIADRQPLRDCTKGEVRELARESGLPADLVDRTPTAGLWPGQTDEGELGFTYDQADRFFLWLLDRHCAQPVFEETLTVRPDAIDGILAAADLPVPRDAAARMIATNRRTRFKRTPHDLAHVLERRGLARPASEA